MIPVPKYLREIAEIYKQKDESLTFGIKCICGCNKFIVLKNLRKTAEISKENKKKIRDSLKWYKEVLYPMLTNASYVETYFNNEKDNFREIVIYSQTNNLSYKIGEEKYMPKIIKTFRIKKGDIPLDWSEINSLQRFDDTIIIKLVCDECRRDYIIFDNRLYGNDAADFEPDNLEEYEFKQKNINGADEKSTEIFLTIKNYWDFNNLTEHGNPELTIDNYSNMFGYIKIQAIINGKSVVIYSEELG